MRKMTNVCYTVTLSKVLSVKHVENEWNEDVLTSENE